MGVGPAGARIDHVDWSFEDQERWELNAQAVCWSRLSLSSVGYSLEEIVCVRS